MFEKNKHFQQNSKIYSVFLQITYFVRNVKEVKGLLELDGEYRSVVTACYGKSLFIVLSLRSGNNKTRSADVIQTIFIR